VEWSGVEWSGVEWSGIFHSTQIHILGIIYSLTYVYIMNKITPEIRNEALDLLREDEMTVAEISDALGIGKSSLYKWKAELRQDPKPGQDSASGTELAQLRQGLEETKAKLEDLDKFLESKEAVFLWAAKKIRSEANRNDESDSGWTPPGK
jgi:transposase-like protein